MTETPDRYKWTALTNTTAAVFMSALDGSIVLIALPAIFRGVHLDPLAPGNIAYLLWMIMGYRLVQAVLVVTVGRLGDMFGRVRIYNAGFAVFTVASILLSFDPFDGGPAALWLIGWRLLQAVGGSMLTANSAAILTDAFPQEQRGFALGINQVAALAGMFIGLVAGGLLAAWDWRAVFWINVPIAAALVLITLRHVPESRDPDATGGMDLLGAALAVLGLGAVTFALTALGTPGAGMAAVVAGLVGVLALAAFLFVERRSPHPLVPLSMFSDRLFSGTNVVTLLLYGALGVYFFLLVLQMQTVAGFSPTVAGTALLPVTVLMLLLSARSGALADRIGPRPQMTIGPLLAAAGFLLAIRIGPGANYLTDVLPATVALGLGLATTVAPLTATVLASADDHHAGVASGINNAVARSAGLLAVAIIPVAAGLGGADYTDPVTYDAGFRRAMLIGAGLLVVASALAAVLIRPARKGAPVAPTPTSLRLAEFTHCGIAGPQLHPGVTGVAPRR